MASPSQLDPLGFLHAKMKTAFFFFFFSFGIQDAESLRRVDFIVKLSKRPSQIPAQHVRPQPSSDSGGCLQEALWR